MAVRHFVGTVATVCIAGASVLTAPSGAHGQVNAPAGSGVGAGGVPRGRWVAAPRGRPARASPAGGVIDGAPPPST
jgi:hypothetical protein